MRHGRDLAAPFVPIDLRPSLADRLADRYDIDTATGCWNWKGRPNSRGYGRINFVGKRVFAHRAMYETLVGPIPEGLTIDHLCRNKLCVNPAHMEPVTAAENTRRKNLGFRAVLA